MDCLILFCALKFLDLSVRFWRIFAAAFFSSLGALFLLMIQPPGIYDILLRLGLYIVMTVIVVFPSRKIFLRFAFLVWAIAALCGGIALSVICLEDSNAYVNAGQMLVLYLPAYLWPIGTCLMLFCFLLIKKWLKNICFEKNTAQVHVWINGKVFSCIGYFDTGNMHADPMTGLPIVVMCADVLFDEVLEDNTDFLFSRAEKLGIADRVSLVPVHTVSGGGLLVAIRPEKLLVDDMAIQALVALVDAKLDEANRFKALLPVNFKKKV